MSHSSDLCLEHCLQNHLRPFRNCLLICAGLQTPPAQCGETCNVSHGGTLKAMPPDGSDPAQWSEGATWGEGTTEWLPRMRRSWANEGPGRPGPLGAAGDN